MKCPECRNKLLTSIVKPIVYYCNTCDFLYKFSEKAESLVPFGRLMPNNRQSVRIPEITEGTNVYIDNLEHKFHLEFGIVYKRDHEHYRVKLSIDKKDIFIWMPKHWVKKLPDELISNQRN